MSSQPSPALPVPPHRSGSERLRRLWPRERPLVMGIVNCTPDSFSDGGRFLEREAALEHAVSLLDQGADLIDIGGESTRPGAAAVPAEEERQRVLPVISSLLRRRPDTLISIDTSKPEVADAALAAGAVLVNDVSAAAAPNMLETVAAHGAGLVLMHMRGSPGTMQQHTGYQHVVAEVHGSLRRRAAAAVDAGIDAQALWLDPGIGFGKDDDGNLALLATLPDLASLGYPVVIGPSRKSFIGRLTGAGVGERLPGTLAALLPALAIPRAVVRVHEVGPVRQFLEIAVRLRRAELQEAVA